VSAWLLFYLDRNVFWCVDWILQFCQVQFLACYRGLLPCAERCTHGESSVLSINNTTQEFINNTIEEQAAARISENETTLF
jgi:recombinational DNA repair protein RecT